MSLSTTVLPTTTARQQHGRRVLLLLAAWFAAPLLLAIVLVQVWRPTSSSAHGELLATAVPLRAELYDARGQLRSDWLQGRWTLLYLGAEACAQDCRHSLYFMRQLHSALGRDWPRVHTLYVRSAEASSELQQWLTQEHPDLALGYAANTWQTQVRNAFSSATQSGIYLIDPLGNLVLRYPAQFEQPSAARGVLQDLRRLLKYSQLG